MEQSTAKGAGFLKVTGILMIIGGAIDIIFSIIALFSVPIVVLFNTLIEPGMLYAADALALVGSIAQLVAGIIGVANCKKPEKAMICIVFGVIVAVLNVAGVILNVVSGNSSDFVSLIIGLVLGLVLPVLYIVGAYMNKKAQ